MKALIIGYGSIGRRHREVLADLPSVLDTSIVSQQAVSDIDCYPSLFEIDDLNQFGYFVIASPTHRHFAQLQYLDATVKDKKILCEKPLFDHPREFHSERNRILVGYNLRFHPLIRSLKEWLEHKTVLSVTALVGQYLPGWRPGRDYRHSYSAKACEGGGVLRDLSHELDYLQWLFGPIEQLAAASLKISDLEIDSDDYLSMIGRTQTGVMLTLNMDYLSHIPLRQVIVQTQGETAICDFIKGSFDRRGGDAKLETRHFGNSERNLTYRNMHAAFLDDQFGDLCTLQEGLALMKLIKHIQQSSDRLNWND